MVTVEFTGVDEFMRRKMQENRRDRRNRKTGWPRINANGREFEKQISLRRRGAFAPKLHDCQEETDRPSISGSWVYGTQTCWPILCRYRRTCDSLGRAAIAPAWHSSNTQGKRVLPEMSTAEEHFTLGNALAARGDLEGAIAEYEAALRINPNHARTHNNLGIAVGKKGDLERAIVEFRAAARMDSHYAEPHGHLGAILGMRGDVEGAIAEFQALLRINPDHAK